MKPSPFWPRLYIAATVLAGGVFVAFAASQWSDDQNLRAVLYLAVALAASRLRVTLPGITGTMSVNFVFTLISLVDLDLPKVLLVTWAGILGQVIHRARLWSPVQVLFNLASITIAASSAYFVYHSTAIQNLHGSILLSLFLGSAALFATNTVSVSGIIALTEKKPLWGVWRESFWWTASHYLVGAAVAALFHAEERTLGWEAVLLTAPVIYLVYRSYATHIGRLAEAKAHSKELGELHWRTIEALALAIDAKDETTHNHLLRVKVYATEVAKELGLDDNQMQALQAAALLHDIGKLAIPEHIISKPGKLSPEEFEKMKVHPVVGAEILDRVRFPYPVVPIVRSHHEKWNGKGYPAGLKGEEIPIGARILSAVDCLDALASDRQYRKALPVEKAMEVVASESGVSFDPKIVEIIQRRYVELEKMATSIPEQNEPRLSTNVKFELGEAPASGFESSGDGGTAKIDFMVSIGAARQEFQNLFRLTSEIEGLLSVEDIGSLLSNRVKRMVPHDTIVLYIRQKDRLVAEYVNGQDNSYFSNLIIPVGQGLSGWVVENQLPIINGNPSVENTGTPNAFGNTTLRSALSVPLEFRGKVIGAMSLYSAQADYYNRDALRILEAICGKASATIATAVEHQRVAATAVTDPITGLPNTRSLFDYFQTELRRAEAQRSSLAVILIDINGFKQINDSFGHLAGNRMLKQIGQVLKDSCRTTDYAARLGGDEFVIIMPGADERAVSQTIKNVNRMAGPTGEECGRPSLSAGAAFYPVDGQHAEALLDTADQRMYRNKKEHYAGILSDDLPKTSIMVEVRELNRNVCRIA